MIDIENWMEEYQKVIVNEFGDRALFIGLQGSYGRKEAKENSDIDVVLILDKVDMDDLRKYKKITNNLTHRELLCGFVSGADEIYNWSKSDLFQFYFDTKAFRGNLERLVPIINEEDVRQAVISGACNIYHACSHNFLHTMDVALLQSLYKSSFFVIQAKHYYETGTYLCNHQEAEEAIDTNESAILSAIIKSSIINENNFEKYSEMLLTWSSKLICTF